MLTDVTQRHLKDWGPLEDIRRGAFLVGIPPDTTDPLATPAGCRYSPLPSSRDISKPWWFAEAMIALMSGSPAPANNSVARPHLVFRLHALVFDPFDVTAFVRESWLWWNAMRLQKSIASGRRNGWAE